MFEKQFGRPSDDEPWQLASWRTRRREILKNKESEIADAAFSDSGVEFKEDMLVEEVVILHSIFLAFHFVNR